MSTAANRADFTFVIYNTRWHREGDGRYWNHIPYPEGILTAVLRKNGFTVNHIDANTNNYTEEELYRELKEKVGKVVGISALSVEYRDSVHKTLAIIKKADPDVKTVLGGVYPSISPEVAKEDENIDFIVISEGEERLVKLMNALKNKTNFKGIDGLHFRDDERNWHYNERKAIGNVRNLDDLPFPDYSDYDTKKLFSWSQKYTQNFQFRQLPMTIMMTSRGCVYKCTYCGAGKDGNPINDGIKRRSPGSIMEEIKSLVKNHGIREIIFVDDSLLLPRDRIVDILKGITKLREEGYDLVWKSNNLDLRHIPLPHTIKEKKGKDDLLFWMKESGCYQISISLESGSPNTFKRMKRPTNLEHAVIRLQEMRKYGFDEIASNFIIGMPGDTWNDILQTFEFADKITNQDKILDYSLFSIATPLPGTEMYETAKEMKVIPEDLKPEDFYGFGKGVINTEEWTANELQIKRAYEWDRINFSANRPEHHLKIAKMLGITLEELNIWRKETRQNAGVDVKSADKTDEQVFGADERSKSYFKEETPTIEPLKH
jgi:anaerobic magnesium-protoporphyrin IX monomethyl ester cyclase|tara:strand:- start:20399 stop:22033 length:1635 start_codon:yes stop_codon:yes gene_type:complete